MNVSFRTSLFL